MEERLFTIDCEDGTIREYLENGHYAYADKADLVKALKSAKEVRVDKDTENIDWYVWIR